LANEVPLTRKPIDRAERYSAREISAGGVASDGYQAARMPAERMEKLVS
jgi:hypothetical protein